MKWLFEFLKHKQKDIVCIGCGWSWDKEESEKDDIYICHKCGTDNSKTNETL